MTKKEENQPDTPATRRPLLALLQSMTDEERERFMRPLTTPKSGMIIEHLKKQGIPFTEESTGQS